MEETRMDWRDKLKCIVGVTDEKDIADLTDMEEREILATKHLHNMEIVRKLKTDSNIADQDSCV